MFKLLADPPVPAPDVIQESRFSMEIGALAITKTTKPSVGSTDIIALFIKNGIQHVAAITAEIKHQLALV